MRDLRACRSCLITDGKLYRISELQKRIYADLSGVELSKQYEYPDYLCAECQSRLKRLIHFKRKIRRACFVMREIIAVKKEIKLVDLSRIDRKKTNLTSNLDFVTKNNCSYFVIDEEDNIIKQQELSFESNTFSVVITSANVDYDLEFDEGTIGNPEELEEENTAPNIDLEDVFKDLEEKSVQESDEGEDLFDIEVPEANEEKQKLYKSIANVMCTFDMKELSIDEQVARYREHLNTEPFKSSPYKCILCLLIFKNLSVMEEHLKVHCKKAVYKHSCVVCKMKFETKEELDTHTTWSHLYDYTCKKCHEKFPNMHHAKHHKHVVTTEKPKRSFNNFYTLISIDPKAMYHRFNSTNVVKSKTLDGNKFQFTCDICKQRYKFKTNLHNHMINSHLYLYKCNECETILRTRKLAMHHLIDHENKTNQCEHCKLQVPKSLINRHIEKYHHLIYYNYHCPTCGNSFSSEYQFYFHQLNHHKCIRKSTDDALKYRCGECEVNFLTEKALMLHIEKHIQKQTHTEVLMCTMCLKIFNDELKYNEHVCNTFKSYPLDCQECGEKLHDQTSHLAHYTEKHFTNSIDKANKIKYSLCAICGITTKNLSIHNYKYHKHRACCYHCGMWRRSPSLLFLHQLQQHSVRPYRCRLCAARYQKRSQCKDHILKVHAPMNPFSCDICHASFCHLDYLKSHIKNIHQVSLKTQNFKLFKPKMPLVLYPYMMINVSKIDRDILYKCKIYSIDFNNKNRKIIDNPEDYYIYDDDDGECALIVDNVDRKRPRYTENDDYCDGKKVKIVKKSQELVLDDNDFVIEETIVDEPLGECVEDINNDYIKSGVKNKKAKFIKKSKEYLMNANGYIAGETVADQKLRGLMEIIDNVKMKNKKSKIIKKRDSDCILEQNIVRPKMSLGNLKNDKHTIFKNQNENTTSAHNDFKESNIKHNQKEMRGNNDKMKDMPTIDDYDVGDNDVVRNINDVNESSLNMNTNDSEEKVIMLDVNDLTDVREIDGEQYVTVGGILYKIEGVTS